MQIQDEKKEGLLAGNRKWIVAGAVILFLLAMVAIYGRSSGPAQAVAPAAAGGKASSSSSSGLVQTSDEASVTIEVRWANRDSAAKASGNEPLEFKVGMNTHSVDLDAIDLGKQATLRNDRGQEVAPAKWDAAPGGHHRAGSLTFPAADSSGKPIVDSGTKYVEMSIRNVANVKERTLRWSLEGKTS